MESGQVIKLDGLHYPIGQRQKLTRQRVLETPDGAVVDPEYGLVSDSSDEEPDERMYPRPKVGLGRSLMGRAWALTAAADFYCGQLFAHSIPHYMCLAGHISGGQAGHPRSVWP
jgi:hypothetical protein